MDILQTVFHFVVGLIVLAESLNKLERTDIFAAGLALRQRAVLALKAAGWFCIALGSGGVAVADVLPRGYLELGYSLMVTGFALLVLRTRVREVSEGVRPEFGSPAGHWRH